MPTIYHVLSRGLDKRKIFLDNQDRFRFIHDLFEFNDQLPVNTTHHIFKKSQNNVLEGRKIEPRPRRARKLLVNILAFCLMPNHYHLLIAPRATNGSSKFIQKLNAGYVRYFNEKYKRKGTLFEGRYKSIIVNDDSHFIHLPYYIHFNPLDLKFPEWRDHELKDYRKAIKFLENYRWSSHLDYLRKPNFPSVTQREYLLEFFNGSKEYGKSVKQWLRNLETDNINHITLE